MYFIYGSCYFLDSYRWFMWHELKNTKSQVSLMLCLTHIFCILLHFPHNKKNGFYLLRIYYVIVLVVSTTHWIPAWKTILSSPPTFRLYLPVKPPTHNYVFVILTFSIISTGKSWNACLYWLVLICVLITNN